MRVLRLIGGGSAVLFLTALGLFTGVLGLYVADSDPPAWNFPGDPPAFDLLLYPAMATATFGAPVWWLARMRAAWLRYLCWTAWMVGVVVVAGCTLGIAERHGPRWKVIRDAYERDVRENVGPVTVFLPGHGPVEVYSTGGAEPHIRTDFGSGGVAIFDPTTMICVYAD